MTTHQPSYLDTPKRFWLGLLGFWAVIGVSLGFYGHWIYSTLPIGSVLGESILFSMIYTTLFLLLFGSTWHLFHRWFPLSKTSNLWFHGVGQLINFVVGFVAGTAISGYFHSKLVSPAGTDVAIETEIAITGLLCLIGILFINGVYYTRAYMKRSMEAEKRNSVSELRALRAQINPHFLFNSLNSIAALIRISPEKAETVTEDLADLFRYTLRASDRPLVSLSEEIDIIELYLNIEKARFNERLTVQIDVPENLKNAQMPILTLQPLVENAIKHGVSQKEGNHMVTLSAQRQGPILEINCRDTGPGFRDREFSKVLQLGTGLSNVFQRLKLHFGRNVDGAISENGIILKFPYVDEKKEVA